MKEKIETSYDIYDARYRTDPDSATCFEAGCETLKEARESALEYGSDNVIVFSVSREVSPGVWEQIQSDIVD